MVNLGADVLNLLLPAGTEVLFLSIILCLANTGIVNVLVSTLYSKPDEVPDENLWLVHLELSTSDKGKSTYGY